jgi:hypothetical protein
MIGTSRNKADRANLSPHSWSEVGQLSTEEYDHGIGIMRTMGEFINEAFQTLNYRHWY